MEDMHLYNMAATASVLSDYVELTEEPHHDEVMRLVHKINENYVEWSASLDMRRFHVVD